MSSDKNCGQTTSCHDCPVWKKSLFSDLQPSEVAHLDQHKRTRQFRRGEVIFDPSQSADGIYCVVTGVVKISQRTSRGQQTLVRIAPSGDTIGHRSVFTQSHYRGKAEALEPVKACYIPKSLLLDFLNSNPHVSLKLINRMAKDLVQLEQNQRTLREKSVRERLADLLIHLKEAYGELQEDGSWKLSIQLTKVDIAAMLDVADETVIRLMTEFRQDRVLAQSGKNLFVLDAEKLAATAAT